MISLVALVLAVVSSGALGAPAAQFPGLVPYAYSGSQVLPYSPVTYSVPSAITYSAASAPTPLTYSSSVIPAGVTYSAPFAPVSYKSAPVSYSAAIAPVQYSAAASPVAYAAAPVAYAASPVAYAAAPVVTAQVAPVPIAIPSSQSSQFHSQDEAGGYSYGYAGDLSSKTEYRDHFGNVRGSYNYIDNDGEVQTTHYSAGPDGFQVAATNLPIAPLAEAVPASVPIQDTPEVVQARSAFMEAFRQAETSAAAPPSFPADTPAAEPAQDTAVISARKKRSTPVVAVHARPVYPQLTYPFQHQTFFRNAPVVTNYAVPQVQLYNGVVPTVGAPISSYRNAELLRVTNNPGHATSYRVY